MGKTLEALRRLQAIEYELGEVRRRLKRSSAAVQTQQTQIEQLRQQVQTLRDAVVSRQREAAAVELELKDKEQHVAKFRALLNTAKTNKEYAAILTQINTFKADNSKLEDEALKRLQAVDAAKAQLEEGQKKLTQTEQSLEEVQNTSGADVGRLETIQKDLLEKRRQASADIPGETLSVFNRVALGHDGDALARIEVIGRRPPFEYICGGCNMAIRAEHANALRTRDELRYCDVCGRILYLEEQEVT